ncbi:hypothetical protein Hanom_Chr05g00406431 [Helianthus anomalus]
MTTSLKSRDEERMKKNVDEQVDDLKKVAEKEKVEREKEEEAIGDEAVTGEQKTEEGLKKKGEDDAKLKDRLK